MKFNYILDTQKVVMRTIALKRIQSDIFISASAAGIFSNKNIRFFIFVNIGSNSYDGQH